MIEIMCRDGSVPPELLENVADYVRAVVSDDVEVLDEDEHRAMVFWAPSDVADAIKDMESTGFEAEDLALCADLLKDAEPEIHRAMLEAGRDTLNQYLLELDDALDEESEEIDDSDSIVEK